jgi:hypothetical protein
MGTPSYTRRLHEAAARGQEIVADPDGLRAAPLPVVYEPRSYTDPMPWVHEYDGGWARRFKAVECFPRLALPLPAGTTVEHTQSRIRGAFLGEPEDCPAGFVLVEFHPAKGARYTLTVSRNLLRLVAS